ncbi:hypothetical protein HA402_014372 [Bradysia odoriphaga]|nr:hypothetical protein HA402_014372 [Bradysia odoriphaga]
MYSSESSDIDEMMSILPLLLLQEEADRRRERNFRQFVPTTAASSVGSTNNNASLDNALLHLLETGRFSDVQFQVGTEGYCFNCHRSIVGGRSEVLAIAMQNRWTENRVENNLVLDKTVIRLPGTDVGSFKVFLKYLYSDKLDLSLGDENYMDLLLKVMSLSHMYQVDGLLQECVTQLNAKINVRTCWKIYKETRLIAPSLSEKCFKFLCDWQKLPTVPSEPPRKEIFEQLLLPLIRFPSMNLATFSKVIETKVLPLSEIRRLRRFIVNPNPRKRNTSIYSNVLRFTDIFPLKLSMYAKCISTTCKDNDWDSSHDNFMSLIDSHRAEFSIETNAPTTVYALTLHNARKWNYLNIQCPYNLKITFQIYVGQSVMHKEERSLMIGGPSTSTVMTRFVLREPFQMNPGLTYEFHVLYTLLEDDPGMANENESYEYDITWSAVTCDILKRKVGHGIVFKMNYKVEEDDEDDVEHDQTPRWIQSVDFTCKVSQNCQQLCTVS